MNRLRVVKLSSRTLVGVILIMAMLGCTSTTEKLASAVPPTEEPGVSATPLPTQEAQPSATATPTRLPPTPTAEPEPVGITAQGFGQDDRSLAYAFIVENPNMGLSIERSQYQVGAYDAEGVVVDTDSGYVELLLPGQTLGVVGTMYLDEGVTVARVEPQLNEGDAVASEGIPTFTVDSVSYHAGEYSSAATGIVKSPYNADISSVKVFAVAYNATGDIVGGGFTYLSFILANGTTGVEVAVTTSKDEEVASVDLYLTLSGLSLLTSQGAMPAGTANLVLSKSGFGQQRRQVAFGLLVENPNQGFSVEDTQYHVTIYAEDGTVLGTEGGYINVILPNQTLGVAGSVYLFEGMTASRVDVQLKAGTFKESDVLPVFTAENVVYHAGEYSSKVTGQVVSPYASDITDVRVCAIAYDEAGRIVGGGLTYLDFVPASGRAAVEVFVTAAGEPATVELYPAMSALSEIKP